MTELVRVVRNSPDRALAFELDRDGRVVVLEVTPEAAEEGGERIGRIGVGVAQPPPGGGAKLGEVREGVLEGQ